MKRMKRYSDRGTPEKRGIRVIRDRRCSRSLKLDGFTLIEVLIAMAIIGIGLITLLTLFPIGLRSSRLAGDFTTASFIAQQALDDIRALAQVYDPGDDFFDNTYNARTQAISGRNSTNHNGLGYYELPVSAVKGYLSPLRFPNEPTRSQDWTITIQPGGPPTTFSVTGSASGDQNFTTNPGRVGLVYTSDNKEISFILYDNQTGSELGTPPYNSTYDINLPMGASPAQTEYDDFMPGDKVVIHIDMRGGVPYYWYAMRSPVTEDQDLDGILDGWVVDSANPPNYVTARPAPHNIVREDTGLDLVPDYFDSNNTGSYEYRLDRDGEFSDNSGMVQFPGDPHGDNMYRYDTTTGALADPSLPANISNPDGTEWNGKIDAWQDDYIQKVTITIGWREGGQDRAATFSASIPNQFR